MPSLDLFLDAMLVCEGAQILEFGATLARDLQVVAWSWEGRQLLYEPEDLKRQWTTERPSFCIHKNLRELKKLHRDEMMERDTCVTSLAEPFTLEELPTEILFQIFEDQAFPVEALYTLALLCRRLHFIALPVYLSCNGLDMLLRDTLNRYRRDALSALKMALFTPSTFKNFTCTFPHPSCTPTLQTVGLNFDAHGLRCLGVGDDGALRAWASARGDLLNCVAKGCESLTMAYRKHFSEAHLRGKTLWTPPLPPPSPPSGLFGHLGSLFRPAPSITYPPIAIRPQETTADLFHRVRDQGREYVEIHLPRTSFGPSYLTSLNTNLLRPPALSWTLEALQSCPVSLSLGVDLTDWNFVLPVLGRVADRLTSVSFLKIYSVENSVLMTFLAQIPQLQELELCSRDYLTSHGTPYDNLQGPCPSLPHLFRLRAPPQHISFVLQGAGDLSALRSVTILAHTRARAPILAVETRFTPAK
ncbi:hypothetical protein B0H16DRAFT_1761831 [Mycena metata]|uniref:F-box domain-containing protein n=1 Tax=Mycena metata TaxID=1033252 RepID=A0AAD7I9Q6_9AGAR|nr:hypothetical protein B0H16DRAFT_1761831 [Mycena metata]